jgi:hypothetical protein
VAKKNAQQAAETEPSTKPKLTRFIRIIEHPLKPGDAFQGYQPECIWLDENDKVVRRKVIDKPNLFEYAYLKAGEIVDPRVELSDDTDF